MDVTGVQQLGCYSKVDRDPRGRTLTVAYLAIIDEAKDVKGLDDATKAEWFPINNLPELAFDHNSIMIDAIKEYQKMLF